MVRVQVIAAFMVIASGSLSCGVTRYAHIKVPNGEEHTLQITESENRKVKKGEPVAFTFNEFCLAKMGAWVWGPAGFLLLGMGAVGVVEGDDSSQSQSTDDPSENGATMDMRPFQFIVGSALAIAAVVAWWSCSWGDSGRVMEFRVQKPGRKVYKFDRAIVLYGSKKESRNNPFTLKLGKY